MTKAFSEEYGKRIFPVFASFQVAGTKGNFSDPDDARLLTREATKYITDFGYDAYGFDFRRPYSEAMTKKINEISQKFPEVTSVDDYYRFYSHKHSSCPYFNLYDEYKIVRKQN